MDDRGIAAAGEYAVSEPEAAIRRSYVTRLGKQRMHQQEFRQRVLRAYREQCAICRLRHEELLDAAHILQDGHPRGEPVAPNGLAAVQAAPRGVRPARPGRAAGPDGGAAPGRSPRAGRPDSEVRPAEIPGRAPPAAARPGAAAEPRVRGGALRDVQEGWVGSRAFGLDFGLPVCY